MGTKDNIYSEIVGAFTVDFDKDRLKLVFSIIYIFD